MNKRLIGALDAEFKGIEPNINKILEVESDVRINKILSDIFKGVDRIKYSDLDEVCKTKFVRNLLYDYVDESKILVDEEMRDNIYDNLEDITDVYIKEASRYHVLTVKQEYKYGMLLKNGNEEEKAMAREKFINHNQKLVIKVARKFIGKGMEFIDLIQEGNDGLLTAIDKFDIDKGNKFSTYAMWWIRQSISRGLADKSRIIRIPVNTNDELLAINKYESIFCQKYNREPTSRELALFMNESYSMIGFYSNIQKYYGGCPKIPEEKREYYENKYRNVPEQDYKKYPLVEGRYSLKRIINRESKWYNLNFESDLEKYKIDSLEKKIENIRNNISTVISYDNTVSSGRDNGENSSLLDFIKDEKESVNPEAICEKNSLKTLIVEVYDILELDSRTREVLRLRYGLDASDPQDIREICRTIYGKYTKENMDKIDLDIKLAEEKIKNNPEEVRKLVDGDDECILSLYERVLLELKYSITTGNTYTLEELVPVFNISKERIRQIETRSIKKMRKDLFARKKIKEYA